MTNDVDISVEAVDQLTFGQEYTNPNVKMIRALRSALTACGEYAKRLHNALGGLIDAVDSLDDKILTRDLEPYKAEAVWNDAYDTANKAWLEKTP